MRILLASKRAPDAPGRRPGGVQTWTLTVAAELRRLGHEVDVIGAHGDGGAGGYDLGIFANATHSRQHMDSCERVLVVSHGIVPDEEPRWGDAWAFTSEDVSRYWQRNGRAFDPAWDHPIIRQPIDLEFWSPGKRRAGRTLVRYANRGGLEWLPDVAARLGLQFVHVRNATPEQAREAMRRAQCVLATGRAALEAAACGAPVVICDHRSAYQGPLAAPFGLSQARQNYSGRGGFAPDAESMRRMIECAMPAEGWRQYVQTHHDVREVVRQLLAAAK